MSGRKRRVRNVPNLCLYKESTTFKAGCKEHLGKTGTHTVLPKAKDRDLGTLVAKVIA